MKTTDSLYDVASISEHRRDMAGLFGSLHRELMEMLVFHCKRLWATLHVPRGLTQSVARDSGAFQGGPLTGALSGGAQPSLTLS